MDMKELLGLLGADWRQEQVIEAVNDGLALPKTSKKVKLQTTGGSIRKPRLLRFSEEHVDSFLRAFDEETPGRCPPAWVRRQLLVESNHQCAVCRNRGPFQFHHMIEFSKVKHHDPDQMLLLCGTCHDRVGRGEIDYKAQRLYKAKLQEPASPLRSVTRFSWEDLREVIEELHEAVMPVEPHDQSQASRFDFKHVDLKAKNKLNNLGLDYFEQIRTTHEPYFQKIHDFLRSPASAETADLYHEIVDELRLKLSAEQPKHVCFEDLLLAFYDQARDCSPDRLRGKSRVFSALLSFMYVSCDIGRKG